MINSLIDVPSVHCLDNKNRMRLPQKFRESFEGKPYFVVKGDGEWLDVLDYEQVMAKVELMKKLPSHDVDIHYLIMNFMTSGLEVKEDAQSRFVLPLELREYAGITKDIYIVQGPNNIEIYSSEKWNANVKNVNMAHLRESLAKLEDEEKASK